MTSGIYSLVNLTNNMIYIGSAVNFKCRWKNHLIELRLNRHCNKYLQSAYNKYGEDNFKFEIIEYVDKENLIKREQYHLDKFKSYDRLIGYNLCAVAGSRLGQKPTKETLAKLSAMRKGKKRSKEFCQRLSELNKGRKVSDEARKNMSLAHIGKKLSEETKAKMSLIHKGNKVNLGRKQTQAHKDKISTSNTGRKRSIEGRANMSAAQTGKVHSAETRARMSISARNRKKHIDTLQIVGMAEVIHSP